MNRTQRTFNANSTSSHRVSLRAKSKSPQRTSLNIDSQPQGNSNNNWPGGRPFQASGIYSSRSDPGLFSDQEEDISSNDESGLDGNATLSRPLYKSLRSLPASSLKRHEVTFSPGLEVTSANLRRWLEEEDIDSLETAVLEGYGDRVKVKAQVVSGPVESREGNVHVYVNETLPKIMNKIRSIHAAVSCGDVTCLQDHLDKNDYVLAKDHLGMAPLHKAVILGHVDVVQFILEKFPETINAKDRDGRTALHYAAATTNRNGARMYKMLVRAGADSRIRDINGKTAEYYRVHLLPLPNALSRLAFNTKRKGPYLDGLSPVLRRRPLLLPSVQEKITTALHDGDPALLYELCLEGYGDSLLGRVTWGEEGRKFLRTLPHLLDSIKSLHASVVNGHLDNVQRILSSDPSLSRAKDENGLMSIHLATYYDQAEIIDYLARNFANSITLRDHFGRTCLHIASQKRSVHLYKQLLSFGADPKTFDLRGKTAENYIKLPIISDVNFTKYTNGYKSDQSDESSGSKCSTASKTSPPTSKRQRSSLDITTEEEVQDNDHDLSMPSKEEDKEADGQASDEIPSSLERGDSQERADKSQGLPVKVPTEAKVAGEQSQMSEHTEVEDESSVEHEESEQVQPKPKRIKSPLKRTAASKQNRFPLRSSISKSKNTVTANAIEMETHPSVSLAKGHNKITRTTSMPRVPIKRYKLTRKQTKSLEVGLNEVIASDPQVTRNNLRKGKVKFASEDVLSSSSVLVEDANQVAERLVASVAAEAIVKLTSLDDIQDASGVADEDDEKNKTTAEADGHEYHLEDADGGLIDGELEEFEELEKSSEMTGNEVALATDGVDAGEASEQSADNVEKDDLLEKAIESGGAEDVHGDEKSHADADEQTLDSHQAAKEEGVKDEQQEDQKAEEEEKEEAQEEEKNTSDEKADENANAGEEDAETGQNESQKEEDEEQNMLNEQIEDEEQKTPTKDSIQEDEEMQETGAKSSEQMEEAGDAVQEKGEQAVLADQSQETEAQDKELDTPAAVELKEDDGSSPDNTVDNVHSETAAETDVINHGDEHETAQNAEEKLADSQVIVQSDGHEAEQAAEAANKELQGDGTAADERTASAVSARGSQPEQIGQKSDREDDDKSDQNVDAEQTVVRQDDNGSSKDAGTNDSGAETHQPEDGQPDSVDITQPDEKDGNQAPDVTQVPVEQVVKEPSRHSSTADGEKKVTMSSSPKSVSARSGGRRHSGTTSADDRLNELIDNWIKESDLLRLEHVVIAGQGDRLVGKHCAHNKQVEEFLQLVPAYMAKIKSVHEAVVRGNFNEVRHVLNRKRFALSRDHLGASPLHLAVLHGHMDVLVFIVTQFPETIDGPDNEGRTPLHYAAVVSAQATGDENNQYYDILKKAGANENVHDKAGHVPAYYLANRQQLTVRTLLENYKQLPPASPGEKSSGVDRQKNTNSDGGDENVDVWERPPTADIEARLTPSPGDSDPDDHQPATTSKRTQEVSADVHVDADKEEDEAKEIETMSNEFNEALKVEKDRLHLSIDKMMEDAPRKEPDSLDQVDMGMADGQTDIQLSQIKDQNGQTILHLAASRLQKANVFYKMISQCDYIIAERDASYRTLRGVAVERVIKSNVQTIDKYIIDQFLAQNLPFVHMLSHEGFNIANVVDADGQDVTSILQRRELDSMIALLHDLSYFQKSKDELHTFIKNDYLEGVLGAIGTNVSLVTAKNGRGKCSLHIAILFGNMDIVEALIKRNPAAVKAQDNLGRTPLHYAMATTKVEEVGRLLIAAGASKQVRDVRMRTPSYYYVYSDEIREVKKEEQALN